MIDISTWTNGFLQALDDTFGKRVRFVGLQGSYARGEATETSDLDLVVILDALSPADIRAYDAMKSTLPHSELLCGFLCGEQELLQWEPSDLFQFYHDTTPLRASLDGLLPLLDTDAVERAIKIGVCGIYHGCVHNMLYEKSGDILRGLYKSAVFVIQAICFRETGRYIRKQKDLLSAVAPEEREILLTHAALKEGEALDFEKTSDTLFRWSQHHIR